MIDTDRTWSIMPLDTEALREMVLPTARRIVGGERGELATLVGGASLRRFHRVRIPGGRPASLVVMELAEDRAASEEASHGPAPLDLPFVNVLKYLERGGVGVPRLYHFDEERGLLYLEDLGDVTFESRVLGADVTVQRSYYRRAIDDLVALQRYAADHPGGCIAFERAFDYSLLKWELDHFREWGLEVGAGAKLTPGEREVMEEAFGEMAGWLASQPRGFVHRDYQSRNLMVQDSAAGPSLRLIDFQDALMGTRAYDLVALLRDSYVELAPALLDELVNYYVERSGIDGPSFRTLFDMQTAQRKLKDAGRFVFIDRVKKNPSFLVHIPTSQAYARAALERLPRLARLREVIEPYLVCST